MSELPVLELDARLSERTALPLVDLASRELDLLVFVGYILIRARIELILAVYRLVRLVGKLDVESVHGGLVTRQITHNRLANLELTVPPGVVVSAPRAPVGKATRTFRKRLAHLVTYEQLLEELGLKQEDFNNERLIVVDTCYSGKPMVQYAVGHFMPKAETAYLIHEAFLFKRHGSEKFIKETAASADYISENVFFKRLELKAARERCDDFCLAGRSLVERFDENADVVHVALATILLTASAMLMTKPGKMEPENPTT